MRRMLWLPCALLAGCSLDLPASPLQAGVLPACPAGDVLQAKQCVPLSSVRGGSAPNAERASFAQTATTVALADTARQADQTDAIDPSNPHVILGTSGSSSGTASLDVVGGPLVVDQGVVFAPLIHLLSPISVVTTVDGTAVDVPLQEPGGALGQITVPSAVPVRVRMRGAVSGTGSAANNSFTNCVIAIEIGDSGSPSSQALFASATATFGNDLPVPPSFPVFLDGFALVNAGTWNIKATLTASGFSGGTCQTSGDATQQLQVFIDVL